MSTLLGPAVVLVAIVGTLRIALSQPDQSATATTRAGRVPPPDGAADAEVVTPERTVESAGRGAPVPAMMTPAMPAGFQWIDAAPAAKVRAGFALVVVLAVVGAVLAVAVAGLVIGAAKALQG